MPKLPSDNDSENDADEGPPKPYNTWEEYFDDFDRQLEEAPPTTVRNRIGDSTIRPANEIPAEEMEAELEKLIELLYENNIVIDFIHDIRDREAYLFITEELLNETMNDVRIPDMYSHFIYEEFHPNDEDDIKLWSVEFLDTFFKEGTEASFIPIGTHELYDARGQRISEEEFKKQISDFHSLYPAITDFNYEIINLSIEGDYATVELETLWSGLNKEEQAIMRHQGISTLRFKRSLDIGWDVIQAKIVGWNVE